MVDLLQSSLEGKEHYEDEATWDQNFVQNPCVLTEMTEEEFEQWLLFQRTMHEPTVADYDPGGREEAHASNSQQFPDSGSDWDPSCLRRSNTAMPEDPPNLADLLQSSLQSATGDTAADEIIEVQGNAHADHCQRPLHGGKDDDDDKDELDKIVRQGIDGLATACKSPLHEHNVHEAE